jgi:hypothetical protein
MVRRFSVWGGAERERYDIVVVAQFKKRQGSSTAQQVKAVKAAKAK